jgi:hypothetical protein
MTSKNLSENGSSDFQLVVYVLIAVVIVSVVLQAQSCIRDYNRKKHGWVEVEE